MTTYHCDGFKPIREGAEIGYRTIERPSDAAMVFGERLAKRRYGRRGECAVCRQDSYTPNGLHYTFEVFIGVGTKDGGTSGRNEWLYLTVRS